MPTGENIEPAGGRVTRSLRKRLTSIDSDAPSRPGTPVNVNLQTIPETNTPKKRVTRRASLSHTPSTLTPSKEVTNTPGRRLTRRSSVNFSESDDQSIQPPTIAKPTITAVKEEEPEVETPKEKPKRVLRSTSKSPKDQPRSTKKNSNKTPKNKQTNQHEQELEDENIIVLDDSIDNVALKSSMKKSRVSIKKENLSITDMEKENESTPKKKSPNLSTSGNNSRRKSINIETPSPSKKAEDETPVKSASKRDSIRKQNTPEQVISEKGSGRKSKSAQKEKQSSDAKKSPLVFDKIETSGKSPSRKNLSYIPAERGVARLSLSDTKNQSSPARSVQSAKKSPAKKNHPEPLKNVAFNEEEDENKVKSVYPKTPGLVKSKSYILDGSSNDVDKDDTYKSRKDQSFEANNGTKSDKENSDNEEEITGLDSKTPYKLKLKAVESSTPIQNSPQKQNKTSDLQEQQKEKSAKGEEQHEEGVIAFPKSWTSSVSGSVANTSKIDCILPEKSLEEKQILEKTNKSQSNSSKNSNTSNKRSHDPDVSEAEDDMLEEDCEDYDDDDEENNQNAEKTIFLDDEAMEVADGEESMDSEERAYLEENEVPEYGESIGSQDSEEDGDDCDDEPDEDDASFVVSDDEVVEELLSSEDEVEMKLKTTQQKPYKRIYQETQSSDEEEVAPGKDDTDFCLLVDSSAEVGDKSLNKSLKNNSADIKTKSTKDKSLKEVNVEKEEDVSKNKNEDKDGAVESPTQDISENNTSKRVSRKSESKSKADVEDIPSEEESKLKLSVDDNDSDTDMQEEDEEKCQKKPEASSNVEEVKETSLQKSPKKNNNKSPKRLTQSPRKKSLTTEDSACEADFELITETSLNKSRKSINPSDNLENLNKSVRKSLNEKTNSKDESKSLLKSPKKSRKLSTAESGDTSDDDLQKNEQQQSPQKKRLTKSPKRKSITATAQDESEDNKNQLNTTKNSRKSVTRKSISISENEEAHNVSRRKSVAKSDSLNEAKENSKSRKSLNESRKSLIRTSTEETNDPEDQSTVEKTKLSLDEGSEPEETLSASENPLDSSAGKSLNSSKKARKSLDRNSLQLNESSSELNKSKRRKSIAQQSIIEKAHESSSDSQEDDNKEQLPHVEELNKSNRRKSIAQQSINDKAHKDSTDPEDENDEQLPPVELNKSNRRKSIAQQSIIEKAHENSSDSEEDEKEKQNELNKSNRRKSVSRNSITSKAIIESSVDSEEENHEKSSPEITDNEMESGDEGGAQFSNDDEEENVAENNKQSTSKFLDENQGNKSSLNQSSSSRRKSIAGNESKLDETFQLDPKTSLSSSLHETLHRNVLRKSLNQSHKQKKADSDSEDENKSSQEEETEVNMKQKIVSEKGLSVSLNSIQIKKKKLKEAKAIRNSFTIGVSVRKEPSDDEDSSEAEPSAAKQHSAKNAASSSSENDDQSDQDQNSSSSEGKLLNLSEEDVLEKVKDVHQVGAYKPRKSMGTSIIRPASPSDADNKQKKRIKRTSLYLQDETASNSFVENLAEERKKISEKKRKSNSFCGVIAPSSADGDDKDEGIKVKEPRSEKKLKKTFDPEEKVETVQNVLSRCEQMIEAANEAKRKAKLQAKKVKVKKPKWMDKEEKATKETEKEVEIPLVSKKEIKRKEKMKKELAKALKQSASVLTKAMDPIPKAKQPKLETTNINPSKRLEMEFLDSLMELSNANKKKAKEIETTPPSDKENSKKKSNKQKYKIENIHKRIESDIETLETACGTVRVEPSTPKKLRYQYGFRESPKTPVGFKIQDINSTNKKSDKKSSRKLKTTSGSFIEEDLINSKVSNANANSNKPRGRKRKILNIEEPNHTLPKTQWTPSGVFVEEDLSYARPLANSTATQFLVAPLSSGKKSKTVEIISSSTLNTALSFKKNAINKGVRKGSREILHVKNRKIVNNQF
ncbi:protein slender lobes-like [Eupeodes corollae]|uniref:protein slender lobes-like n=1 Tax=Eupeodes corollae TaxID=290404 RepID=UPI002491C9F7|nr:protein slender lobes-like [Eupeodes corollae]